MNRPNLDFSPAEPLQRPEPSLASLTRTPMRGRTPSRCACLMMSPSSEKFSTTGTMVRPSLVASIAVSM